MDCTPQWLGSAESSWSASPAPTAAVTRSAEKQALLAATGAAAADMESHVAARTRRESTACRSRPSRRRRSGGAGASAGGAAGMRADGTHWIVGASFVSLRQAPGQLPRSCVVAADAWRAYARATPLPRLSDRGLGLSAISASFCSTCRREDVFGRPLAVERDFRRHRPFGLARRAMPRIASFHGLAHRIHARRSPRSRYAPCSRRTFRNCRCRTRPSRSPPSAP